MTAERVLIVEDEADILGLINRFLVEARFETAIAQTVEEAITILDDSGPFDVAVVDFYFPGGTATPLLDLIAERHANIPVILVSGGNDRTPLETVQAVGELSGTFTFLQKPFLKSELLAKVASALEKSSTGPSG